MLRSCDQVIPHFSIRDNKTDKNALKPQDPHCKVHKNSGRLLLLFFFLHFISSQNHPWSLEFHTDGQVSVLWQSQNATMANISASSLNIHMKENTDQF